MSNKWSLVKTTDDCHNRDDVAQYLIKKFTSCLLKDTHTDFQWDFYILYTYLHNTKYFYL